jgi:hypothetical protein
VTGVRGHQPDWLGWRDLTVPRVRSCDSDGCFALDYLRSEQASEPRRALVHALKSGEIIAVNRAASLITVALMSYH